MCLMISIPGYLSFAKLVMMSSAPAKSEFLFPRHSMPVSLTEKI